MNLSYNTQLVVLIIYLLEQRRLRSEQKSVD